MFLIEANGNLQGQSKRSTVKIFLLLYNIYELSICIYIIPKEVSIYIIPKEVSIQKTPEKCTPFKLNISYN